MSFMQNLQMLGEAPPPSPDSADTAGNRQMTIEFGGKPVIVDDGNPDFLVARDKANGFFCPVGPEPGRGWLLMRREDVDSLASVDQPHTLEFAYSGPGAFTLTLQNIWMIGADRIRPGDDDSKDAIFLVKIGDPRILWVQGTTDTDYTHFNLPSYASGTDLLLGTTGSPADPEGVSWNDLIAGIWDKLPATPNVPTMPYTPTGKPRGFSFAGQDAYQALTSVLDSLMLALRYDPIAGEFSIVRLGNPQSDPSFPPTPLFNGQPQPQNIDHAATLRIYFRKWDRSYGQELDVDLGSFGRNWLVNDAYVTDDRATSLPDALSGTVHPIWTDMLAERGEDGELDDLNSDDREARGDELLETYLQDRQIEHRHIVYPGISGHLPGPRTKAVFWIYGTRGMRTEIVDHPGLPGPKQGTHLVPRSADSLFAPDLSQARFPTYPRLSQLVKVDDGAVRGAGDNPLLEANIDGLHPGLRTLWFQGDMSLAHNDDDELIWIKLVDMYSNLSGAIRARVGEFYIGRLSGVITSEDSQRPLYVVHAGIESQVVRFELIEDLILGGTALAQQLDASGTKDGVNIGVLDRLSEFGGDEDFGGESGLQGWAVRILDNLTEVISEESVDLYEIVSMQQRHRARWIHFAVDQGGGFDTSDDTVTVTEQAFWDGESINAIEVTNAPTDAVGVGAFEGADGDEGFASYDPEAAVYRIVNIQRATPLGGDTDWIGYDTAAATRQFQHLEPFTNTAKATSGVQHTTGVAALCGIRFDDAGHVMSVNADGTVLSPWGFDDP